METLLLRLILIAAALEFGIAVSDIESCHSEKCCKTMKKASRDVLKIDWKPIVIFEEEAKRFR